ncbi:hypothetical protein SKAU_G00136660 [Synaphobranchus kaupii]|uniref:MADF domain-containing protein n=1 Tax=Synaphobranchus kaupii TaxID=118154 RepID=A0A9Q1E5I3_SYNKA|nr:hypothetical protein SKAU_G00424100 [Synaphobranchus kaupii]KAJ8346481.1 hypothetical protein SKAU_G00278820 [Synaphobranchus kaupii]KAJ8347868.1 hypothetical protein SKAU_G00264570 [Synaphobranchus kaupii]KAJ8364835.1 hypothetical protein SKAU_G00136660 [Synaphobranchus kaupii]
MTMNSWKEIGESIGMDWVDCIKEWKKIRDKFVRMKRVLSKKSGAAGGSQNKPTFYIMLSWLEVFIKHRETESNYPEEDSQTSPDISTAGPDTPDTPEDPGSAQSTAAAINNIEELDSLPGISAISTPKPKRSRKGKEEDDPFTKRLEQLNKDREQREQLLADLQKRSETDNDLVGQFLKSIGGLLRLLPEKELLTLQAKIHQMVYESVQLHHASL